LTDLRELLQNTLGDDYRIERELGGGGMSRVFVAEDVRLHRTVAVKVLPGELAAGVNAARFGREILLAAQLQHPHIVPVLSAGMTGGLPYYVMPFAAGESLRARLSREGPLPIADVVRVTREVATALAYAHDHGVLHRDIKPDNVLVSHGVTMVTDFGVAKALDASTRHETALTSAGLALGTPAYMAPEQATGDPTTDQRADVYSLGVLAYELLCGTPPFAGRSPRQVLAAHVSETPRPVTECRPDVPPAFASLVMRSLEKDPSRRPQSAGEVMHELDAITLDGARGPKETGARAGYRWVGAGVALALLLLGGLAIARRYAGNAGAKPGGERSIAVLPFENSSNDSATDYFSDGMSEELITGLSRVPGVRVTARTSAFAFKGRNADIREIGRELNVASVLEGSVRRSGNRLRVTARLVDASNGYQVWSDEYERDLTDVFAVQDDLTKAIVAALKVNLSGGTPVAAKHGTSNLEAYNLYLQGRYNYETRTEGGLQKAAELFQQAIALDSNYALAYSGLADSYAFLSAFGYAAPKEMFPRATTATLHALAIDSTLVEAHTSLAFIRLFYDWDFPGAQQEFTRAIAINPRYAPTRLFHSWYYIAAGQPDSSVAEIQRARDLDPLSLIINTRYGTMLHLARRNEEAAAQLMHTLALDSTYELAHAQLARVYYQLHRCPDALREVAKMKDTWNYEGRTVGFTYAACGDRAKAESLLTALQDRSRTQYVVPDAITALYAGLRDREHALSWLERSYDERVWSLFLLKVEPIYDSIRDDPRFVALEKKVGLP